MTWSALRRHRAGSDTIAERGWRRLPDGEDVTAGWDGWPFLDAVEPGRNNDIVLGEHRGVDLMTLRWWHSDGHSHEQGGHDTSDTTMPGSSSPAG